MQIKLTLCGHTVDIFDYIPESAVAAIDEVMLGDINMADESWERVPLDEIMRVFPKLYDEINKEKDEERKEILTMKAKKRVAATDPKRGGVSASSFEDSRRVEVAHMITSIELKNGSKERAPSLDNKDAVYRWVLSLPAPDVNKLKRAVREVDKSMAARLKEAGEA